MQSRLGTAFASPSFAMVSLAVATILLKLPTLDTPAYWDEMGWLRQAHDLSEGGLRTALPGLRPAAAFWGHPPGLHLILATLGKVFGVSPNTAHALIAVFAALGVCATFLLARYWYGARTAWLAALFLLLSPVYFAQSGMFLADMPVTALGVLATYFVVQDRYVPYAACASCMVLLKETAIVLVVALILYRFVVLNPFRQARLRDVARYGLPLAVIGGFMLLQKATTGHFFFIYNFDVELFQLTPALMRRQFGMITRWIFIDQHRFIFTALIVLNLLINPKARRRELWLFAFVVVLSGYSFSVLYFLPRYLLPVLPLFYVLAAASILDLARKPRLQLVAACVALVMMSWSLMSQPLTKNSETSLRYLDIVAMHKAAIDRIARDLPGAQVLTIWPHTEELTRPLHGYVHQPIAANVLAEGPLPEWVKGEPELNRTFRLIWKNLDLCDLWIRYEDLVTKPETVFANLSRLLARELEPAASWSAESVHDTMFKLDRHGMLRIGKISRDQVGIWRSSGRAYSDDTRETAAMMGYGEA